MGNLAQLARYCDCLETPWQRYQPPPKDEQSNKSAPKEKSKIQTQNSVQDISLHHNPPHLQNIFQNEIVLRQFIHDKKMQSLKDDNFSEKSEENSVQTQGDNIDNFTKTNDEIQVIDLSKIQNILKVEAKKKPKFKTKEKAPLVIEQKLPYSQDRNYVDKNQDTLSNMFEQNKRKYFIDNDQAEIYEIKEQR